MRRSVVFVIIIGGLATASFNIYFPLSLLSNDQTSPNTNDVNNERSAYGYRHPRPSFQRVHHTSHNCIVPSASGEYSRKVHIPTAVPHLICIGAQKSGTSTLQNILNMQQHTVKPSYKRTFEPHFFDWEMTLRQRQHLNDNGTSPGARCSYSESYSKFFDMSNIQAGVSVAFEKTPSYLMYPSIPSAIEAVCPWKPKILATLRNPVDRAWSQHVMNTVKRTQKQTRFKSFVDLVNSEILQFKTKGILVEALTIQQFNHSGGEHPFRFRDNMTLYDYAALMRGYVDKRKSNLLYRGLYAPLLYPWVETFAPEDRLMVLQFEKFAKLENEKNKTIVDELLGFAGLDVNSTDNHVSGFRRKLVERNSTYSHVDGSRRKLVWSNKRDYDPMPPSIRQYLTLFYQPFNDHLADLLGDDWKNVWD